MGKRSEDWIPFHGWDSDDWKDAGRTALYAGVGLTLGGVAGAYLAGTGAGVALGGALGAGTGASKAEEVDETNEATRKADKAAAAQAAEVRNNEILRKQSLMSAQNTMTAREAMARNINAAIKKMYSPKTASNNPNPYALGGEKEVLG